MSGDIREIAINARRARFMAEHWDDEKIGLDVAFEVACVRRKIDDLMKKRPEFRAKLAQLDEEVGIKEFWKNLAENMEGTHFDACGLEFQVFEYYSALKPLWWLETYEMHSRGGEVPATSAQYSSSTFSRRRRKWGFHPIGCLGRLVKLFFKLLLPAWLVWYAFKLWSPPYGDLPKPEPAKPKPAASVAAAKSAAGRPTAGQTQQGAQVGGKRFVVKQPLPIYRLDEEKHPVVAARVPAGSVVRVTGNLNAKVARVEVELPNGRKGKGLARLVDLQQLAESAE